MTVISTNLVAFAKEILRKNICIKILFEWRRLTYLLKILRIIIYYILIKFVFKFICKKRSTQKQLSRGVLIKRCSEYMQQIYRRTHMPKCDNFIEITLRHGCSPVNLLHIFRTPFYKNAYGGLVLSIQRCF